MSKYRTYKNGIYGKKHNGYYIVPEKEGRKITGFHVLDEEGTEIRKDIGTFVDAQWEINLIDASETEKKLVRKLYSMEVIDLTILMSQLMERGDNLNERERMLNKWIDLVRDRKARGIPLEG